MSMEEMFNHCDNDGNGSISEDEFRHLTKLLETPLTKHRISEIFSKIKG